MSNVTITADPRAESYRVFTAPCGCSISEYSGSHPNENCETGFNLIETQVIARDLLRHIREEWHAAGVESAAGKAIWRVHCRLQDGVDTIDEAYHLHVTGVRFGERDKIELAIETVDEFEDYPGDFSDEPAPGATFLSRSIEPDVEATFKLWMSKVDDWIKEIIGITPVLDDGYRIGLNGTIVDEYPYRAAFDDDMNPYEAARNAILFSGTSSEDLARYIESSAALFSGSSSEALARHIEAEAEAAWGELAHGIKS